MTHKLEIEEIRHGEVSTERPMIYYYCRCGDFSGESMVMHRRPVIEEFMQHLENVRQVILEAREAQYINVFKAAGIDIE